MSCGCEDIENDKAIIAEVERRKQVKKGEMETIYYSGELFELAIMYKELDIKKIEKVNSGEWKITYEKKEETIV